MKEMILGFKDMLEVGFKFVIEFFSSLSKEGKIMSYVNYRICGFNKLIVQDLQVFFVDFIDRVFVRGSVML